MTDKAYVGSLLISYAVPSYTVYHRAHLEMLDKLTPDVMGALTFNGLVGTVLSDVLWAEAVLLTSPLAVNLSTCLTIPLAFLVDHVVSSPLRLPPPHPFPSPFLRESVWASEA